MLEVLRGSSVGSVTRFQCWQCYEVPVLAVLRGSSVGSVTRFQCIIILRICYYDC